MPTLTKWPEELKPSLVVRCSMPVLRTNLRAHTPQPAAPARSAHCRLPRAALVMDIARAVPPDAAQEQAYFPRAVTHACRKPPGRQSPRRTDPSDGALVAFGGGPRYQRRDQAVTYNAEAYTSSPGTSSLRRMECQIRVITSRPEHGIALFGTRGVPFTSALIGVLRPSVRHKCLSSITLCVYQRSFVE